MLLSRLGEYLLEVSFQCFYIFHFSFLSKKPKFSFFCVSKKKKENSDEKKVVAAV